MRNSFKKPAGQLIMPRIDFHERGSVEAAKELVDKYSVCGFIIFNGEVEQVRKTLSELRSSSDYPLLFGCDGERGLGQVVKGATKFPFLMSQGAANVPELVREQARVTADEMKYCGLNLLFAPVLDINTNRHNPIINIRSFGDNAALVTSLGTEFIKAAQEKGVICCGKHFPGHGDCDTDSHVSLPQVNKSLNELRQCELLPFIGAVNKKLLSIMLAHVNYKAIDADNSPATFSPRIIDDLLRNEVGFGGLVISDSFRMDALNQFGKEFEVALRSIRAGCNIILDPKDPFTLLDELNKAMDEDKDLCKTFENRSEFLNSFRERNISDEIDLPRTRACPGNDIVEKICESSVCRLKGGTINPGDVDVVIADIADMGRSVSGSFIKELEEEGFSFRNISYFEVPTDIYELKDFEVNGTVILLIFSSVRAWKKYSFLTDDAANNLVKFMKRAERTAVISMGSPYVLSPFVDVDIKIAVFDSLPQCQIAAAGVLTGKLGVKGEMPVNNI